MPKRVIILGAAGRDFHNFNILFRDNKEYEVVGFTANQIPYISGRRYPASLAGSLYKDGIQIYDEADLSKLIKELNVDMAVLSYSDLNYTEVMHKASIANAAGADFWLVAPEHTMLKSNKKVIAVCAVRTGSGKSQTSRYIAKIVKSLGMKAVVIRHPMPYGDLEKQKVQRFESLEDLDKNRCTIEEREDYEPHIRNGFVVYSGVDYEAILREAEKEADLIIWDGGNNDAPFIKPDLMITVADPLRVGHELSYYPGEIVARMADIIVINKVNSAKKEDVDRLISNLKSINSKAKIVLANSEIYTEEGQLIKGKRVLVIEDGPTVTHGEMRFGAATVAAKIFGAREILDPRPFAVGEIKATFEKYKHLDKVLPAVGYSDKQIKDLEDTINNSEADLVISATPTDLRNIIKVNKKIVQIRYELKPLDDTLESSVKQLLKA
ncbi:MAG: cyclic 2,3-diphosphoglycerate synthetase [Candidatus Micrarchaeota archaeon]|nr:MAG: cyclic 2,3-diphosphoglycerate synthetase [Candidatus Micrarchaeota archaeon]